jgi:hypothetical protein
LCREFYSKKLGLVLTNVALTARKVFTQDVELADLRKELAESKTKSPQVEWLVILFVDNLRSEFGFVCRRHRQLEPLRRRLLWTMVRLQRHHQRNPTHQRDASVTGNDCVVELCDGDFLFYFLASLIQERKRKQCNNLISFREERRNEQTMYNTRQLFLSFILSNPSRYERFFVIS